MRVSPGSIRNEGNDASLQFVANWGQSFLINIHRLEPGHENQESFLQVCS
jgi:hypothetical protein